MLAPITSFAATPALASLFAASRPSNVALSMSGGGFAETGRFRDFADYMQHREVFMREKTAQLQANKKALEAALDKAYGVDTEPEEPEPVAPAAGAGNQGGYQPPAAGYAPPAAPAAPAYNQQPPAYQPPQQQPPAYQPPAPAYQPPAPAYQPPAPAYQPGGYQPPAAAPPSGGVPGLY